MKALFRVLMVAVLLAQTAPARADQYIEPSQLALLQTMLRFGALDINNDVVIDDYAKIAECDLYSVFRSDDFKWNKIRDGLRSKIRNESITYPANYIIKGLISIERYDFNSKMFRIDSNSPIMGVNAFRLESKQGGGFCNARIKSLPLIYIAVIENRVNVPGFIMNENDAQALLERLLASGNKARQIMAKFNLRIVDVPKVRLDYNNKAWWYDEHNYIGKDQTINMSAKLDSVEFFEDPQMKRRIFIHTP